VVEIAHRGVRLARRRHRGRVEGIVPVLTHPPSRAYLWLAKLGATAHVCLSRRGQEGVGPLGPQPVGLREGLVEIPAEARIRERGRLVDDRVGLRVGNGPDHGLRVEQVERDRHGAKRLQAHGVLG
jgi:hypothetical protein